MEGFVSHQCDCSDTSQGNSCQQEVKTTLEDLRNYRRGGNKTDAFLREQMCV